MEVPYLPRLGEGFQIPDVRVANIVHTPEDSRQQAIIYIDYAHTPNLALSREKHRGRMRVLLGSVAGTIVVFLAQYLTVQRSELQPTDRYAISLMALALPQLGGAWLCLDLAEQFGMQNEKALALFVLPALAGHVFGILGIGLSLFHLASGFIIPGVFLASVIVAFGMVLYNHSLYTQQQQLEEAKRAQVALTQAE